jgi:hypothetical protein
MRMRVQSECSAAAPTLDYTSLKRVSLNQPLSAHVAGGKVWVVLVAQRLPIRAVAIDEAAAQDPKYHGNADSNQQKRKRMTQVTSEVREQEHTDTCIDQYGEDVAKCAT